MTIYRIGFCQPNPGPKNNTGCRWYTRLEDLLKEARVDDEVYVQKNGRYVRTSIEELKLKHYGQYENRK